MSIRVNKHNVQCVGYSHYAVNLHYKPSHKLKLKKKTETLKNFKKTEAELFFNQKKRILIYNIRERNFRKDRDKENVSSMLNHVRDTRAHVK